MFFSPGLSGLDNTRTKASRRRRIAYGGGGAQFNLSSCRFVRSVRGGGAAPAGSIDPRVVAITRLALAPHPSTHSCASINPATSMRLLICFPTSHCAAIIAMAAAAAAAQAEAQTSKHFLFLSIDDLAPIFGQTYGPSWISTPFIDELAEKGVVFDRAFCQAATCGVSRSSFLTGRRVDTTHVYSNG